MVQRIESVTLRLTTDELARIDQQARVEGRDRSGLIRWAISHYLQEQK